MAPMRRNIWIHADDVKPFLGASLHAPVLQMPMLKVQDHTITGGNDALRQLRRQCRVIHVMGHVSKNGSFRANPARPVPGLFDMQMGGVIFITQTIQDQHFQTPQQIQAGVCKETPRKGLTSSA